MDIGQWLTEASERLNNAGIGTARLDALVLLEDLLGRDRAHLLAHPEIELTAEQLSTLNEHISQRARHVPLAYIRGKTEFYGRMFVVNEYVLEPRPESETMIDMLKGLPADAHMTIVDVGTGSGALAITAKLELPEQPVIAIDIDARCLELARQNARLLKADITLLQGDLLAPLALFASTALDTPQEYVLLCNLPYIPDDFHINQAAMHEPRLAIFGGSDGLDLYRKLFVQLDTLQHKPAYILTESLPPQHETLAEIAQAHEYRQTRHDDFIQLFEPQA